MREDKKSVEMRLFYDFDAKKAAIEMTERNRITKLIFNYDTNEIHELRCKLFRIQTLTSFIN
jgi:hypothetical protein